MPTYDYQCRSCDHRFELRQGFDADTLTDCPQCGQLSERRISVVPVIFKGSGWYVNDYGKKKSTLGDAPPAAGDDANGAGSASDHGHSHDDHSHTHSHGDHDHGHDHGSAPASSVPDSASSGS